MGIRQWAVGSGQWAVGSGQWAVGSGQWAVGSGQWAVGSGQWANFCEVKLLFNNQNMQFVNCQFLKNGKL